jgi:hypothetical protein
MCNCGNVKTTTDPGKAWYDSCSCYSCRQLLSSANASFATGKIFINKVNCEIIQRRGRTPISTLKNAESFLIGGGCETYSSAWACADLGRTASGRLKELYDNNWRIMTVLMALKRQDSVLLSAFFR